LLKKYEENGNFRIYRRNIAVCFPLIARIAQNISTIKQTSAYIILNLRETISKIHFKEGPSTQYY
ncbi:TPA: hypothetical protein ACYHG3_002775, partial [Staphylococcus aureus]